MRRIALLALVIAAACGGDDGGSPSGACTMDSDCGGGNVCARDESCWPAGDVRAVSITWTIDGSAAGSATCSQFPDFFINFGWDDQAIFGFLPVPCMAGVFPVDKLPDAYTQVELGDANGEYFDQLMNIDANGSASFDLVP